ncbi:hypothetical protein BH20BAC1_BH20BAC1_21430 [soil metagenome]
MKYSFLLIVFFWLIFFPFGSYAQRYDYADDPYYRSKYQFEIGGSVGVMNCFTDLGGTKGLGGSFLKDLNIKNTQPAGSIYFTAYYRSFIALRFEGTFGRVRASDDVLGTGDRIALYRYTRNLSFRSNINEVMLVAEIHPLYAREFKQGRKIPLLSPYLVGGIGLFTFSPQAKLNGEWVYLRSLSTEGQGFPEYPDRKRYSLQQICLPLGGGVKYKLSPLFNTSVEVVYRILNTDYLDDVSTNYIDREVFSKNFTGKQLEQALLLHDRKYGVDPNLSSFPGEQRGNPDVNDSYFTFNIKIGLVL